MDASDCRLIDLQRGPGSSLPGELFQAFMAFTDEVLGPFGIKDNFFD